MWCISGNKSFILFHFILLILIESLIFLTSWNFQNFCLLVKCSKLNGQLLLLLLVPAITQVLLQTLSVTLSRLGGQMFAYNCTSIWPLVPIQTLLFSTFAPERYQSTSSARLRGLQSALPQSALLYTP